MALSRDIISQFVKTTNDNSRNTDGVTAYGRIVIDGDKHYVVLDGSNNRQTPIDATRIQANEHDDTQWSWVSGSVEIHNNDRVAVLLKDHKVTITGNITSPSPRFKTVEVVKTSLTDNITVTTANVKRLDAVSGDIKTLNAKIISTDELVAKKAYMSDLEITNELVAKKATIEALNATNSNVTNLTADVANVNELVAKKVDSEELDVLIGRIDDLETSNITTSYLEANYAKIDLANVTKATIGAVLADIGLITEATITEGHVTGYLDSVEINANKITAGILAVERLVITGSDKSIVYALNNSGGLTSTSVDTIDGGVITKKTITADHIVAGAITTEKLAANAVTAEKILAKTISADKLNINALESIVAKIGSFDINKALYTNNHSAYNSAVDGVYLGSDYISLGNGGKSWLKSDGSVSFGLGAIIYNATTNELDINANSLKMASKSIATTEDVNNIQVGGRNIALGTNQGTSNWEWNLGEGDYTKEEIDSNGVRAVKLTRGTTEQAKWSVIQYTNLNLNIFEPNTEYTVSFDVYPSVNVNFGVTIQKSNGQDYIAAHNTTSIAEANKWTKLSVVLTSRGTLPVISSQLLYLSGMSSAVNVSYIFKNLKIEKGNKATDWTPAPEDVDSKITSLGSRVSSTESSITQLSDRITSNVTETDGLKQRMTTMEQNASGFTWSIDETAIVSSVNEYYQSTSSTSLSGGSWSTTQPTWTQGKYIWSRTKNTNGKGTTSYTTAVCITGNTGAQGIQGPKGDKGDTGAQGLQGLQGPKGDQGIQGPKGDAGSDGATGAQGPKGDKGDTGATGAQGPKGDTGTDGKTSYFHIKYSSVASPTSSSQMTETPNTYIGTYVDYTSTDSTDPSKYTWCRFQGVQGAKGDQGIAGTNGTNGQTSYLHIAYANNSTGTSGFSVSDSTNKLYIGQYTDFTQADSTDAAKYSWTRIKGETGATGATGAKGDKGDTGSAGAKGDTGATGTGVASITAEYYVSTSKTSQTGGSWSTTTPTWSSGKYIWTRNKIVYKDPASTGYTTPVCDSSWEAVNEVEVGSRNYCRNSGFQNGTKDYWTANNNWSVDSTKKFNGNPAAKVDISNGTSNGWIGPVSYCLPTEKTLSIKAGETWTGSCWYYVEDASTFDTGLSLEIKGKKTDATSESGLGSKGVSASSIVEGKWIKLSVTVTPDADYRECCIRSYVTKNGTAWFANFKMEKGNKPTDWSPAPEDIQDEINSAKEEASKVATNYMNLNATDGLVIGDRTAGTLGGNVQIKAESGGASIALRDGTTILSKYTAINKAFSGITSAVTSSSSTTESDESESGTTTSTITGYSQTLTSNQTKAVIKFESANTVYFDKGIRTDKVSIEDDGIINNGHMTLAGSIFDKNGRSAFDPITSEGNLSIGYGRYKNATSSSTDWSILYGNKVKIVSKNGAVITQDGSTALETSNANGNMTLGYHLFKKASGAMKIYGGTEMRLYSGNTGAIYSHGSIIPNENSKRALGSNSVGWSNITIGNSANAYNGLRMIVDGTPENMIGRDASGRYIIGNNGSIMYFDVKNVTTTNTGTAFRFSSSNYSAGNNTGSVWLFGACDETSRYIGSYLAYQRTSTAAANMHITANGVFGRSTSSSERYKTDISVADISELKGLYNLPVKKFKYKNDYIAADDELYDKHLYGFIVEDLEDVLPCAVQHITDEDGNSVPEMWNSNIMIPSLLKLIQDLNKRVSELEAKGA